MDNIIVFFVVLTITLFLICLFFISKNRRLKDELEDLSFKKQSLSSKYGKMTEQFLPFLEGYPYNPQNFRFIGTPIDGIQFEDDKIVFIEFKTSNSRLTEKQERIVRLVEDGKVEFEEFRI